MFFNVQGIVAALALLALARPAAGAPAERTYHLRFAAQVAGQRFACGHSYAGIGADRATLTPESFRFYVSEVALVDSNGVTTPLTLEQDGTWQRRDVAFIDFDAGAGCSSGGSGAHDQVTGSAPDGHYVGLRFTLGVPEDLDHADATIAESPLNLSEMFWSWQDGYKFLNLDARVRPNVPNAQPETFVFHLGSSGCSETNKTVHCRFPNRPVIALDRFDPATSVVVADLAGLLRTTDLRRSNGGCMSDFSTACPAAMHAVGLDSKLAQTLFSVK